MFTMGDIACAEGALSAGCRYFGGYPITPATEIAEWMSMKMPEVGGAYVQYEDEIASITSVIGASWTGTKSMTATSGPGVSLMLEALGFAEEGKGIEFTKKGETAITGKIPVNTGGGLIAFGHPVGTTGVKQVFEIYRQMKGQCGDYQVSPPPEHGISANMGGDDRTTVVITYKS